MTRKCVLSCLVAVAMGHGNMINPRPRSSHSQTFDESNKCGSANPYSNASGSGSYCGLGCLGDACLYYQVGCFRDCSSCSLQTAKTSSWGLYPVPAALAQAGCDADKLPEPTLGGGNATHEHELRSYNIDNQSWKGDWTKWSPWRSPGHAGKGNPNFPPCGVNSGAVAGQLPPTTAKDVPITGPGTDLPPLPEQEWAIWKTGSVVEAEWAIYANHGGGYSYRLCKNDGQTLTEECYQHTPLQFATPETEIRYKDGSRDPFKITSPTTSVGTFPPGSQWRKSPVPMCNCDIGISCWKTAEGEGEGEGKREGGSPPSCKAVPRATCGASTKYTDNCLKCGPGTGGSNSSRIGTGSGAGYDCEECCPGCVQVTKDSSKYCDCKGPGPAPAPKPSHKGMNTPYPNTHFRPGQTSDFCPTGVQFPTLWDDGAGSGRSGIASRAQIKPGKPHKGFGSFMFTMVDMLKVPAGIAPGNYSVSWRWDCEETAQVWNSCADVKIIA